LIELIYAQLNAYPDRSSDVIAKMIVDELAKDDLKKLATRQVELIVEHHQRRLVRKAEMAASISSTSTTREDLRAIARAEEDARIEALREELAPQIRAAVSRYREAIVMQWTQELLDSRFALGDGRRPTWGEATTEEHECRIQLLLRSTHGGLMAIARHEAALSVMRKAGVRCLNEVKPDGEQP